MTESACHSENGPRRPPGAPTYCTFVSSLRNFDLVQVHRTINRTLPYIHIDTHKCSIRGIRYSIMNIYKDIRVNLYLYVDTHVCSMCFKLCRLMYIFILVCKTYKIYISTYNFCGSKKRDSWLICVLVASMLFGLRHRFKLCFPIHMFYLRAGEGWLIWLSGFIS